MRARDRGSGRDKDIKSKWVQRKRWAQRKPEIPDQFFGSEVSCQASNLRCKISVEDIFQAVVSSLCY